MGVCWSHDEHKAEAHWGSFGNGHVKWMILSVATVDQIDWRSTVMLNAYESEEAEIRLKNGISIPILGLKCGDEEIDVEHLTGQLFNVS